MRTLRYDDARALARRALGAAGPDEVSDVVATVVRELGLAEAGHAAGEGVDGGPGVIAVGGQP